MSAAQGELKARNLLGRKREYSSRPHPDLKEIPALSDYLGENKCVLLMAASETFSERAFRVQKKYVNWRLKNLVAVIT